MKLFHNTIDEIKTLGGTAQSAFGCEEHRKSGTVCIYNMRGDMAGFFKGNPAVRKSDGGFFGGRLRKWRLGAMRSWQFGRLWSLIVGSSRLWSVKKISNGEFRVSNGKVGRWMKVVEGGYSRMKVNIFSEGAGKPGGTRSQTAGFSKERGKNRGLTEVSVSYRELTGYLIKLINFGWLVNGLAMGNKVHILLTAARGRKMESSLDPVISYINNRLPMLCLSGNVNLTSSETETNLKQNGKVCWPSQCAKVGRIKSADFFVPCKG